MTQPNSLADSFASPLVQQPGEGYFVAFLCNRTNIGRIAGSATRGIGTQLTELSYPDREQPKPWTPKEWRAIGPNQVLPFASPLHNGSSTRWVPMAGLAGIADRGSKQVETGKRYRFVTETTVGVRLCFELLGVEGGSTIRPGFEVFDLPARPGAWTQIWATDFIDEWSLRISNPYFESWARLSVELVPFAKRVDSTPFQRLMFSIEGHGNFQLPKMHGDGDLPWMEETPAPVGPCHVRADEGTFTVEAD